jgi:hypothetical protein
VLFLYNPNFRDADCKLGNPAVYNFLFLIGFTKAIKATLEAFETKENILSPQKRCPKSMPYKPPTNAPFCPLSIATFAVELVNYLWLVAADERKRNI